MTGADIVGWLMRAVPYAALLLLVTYLILGGVLDYHWRNYGVGIVNLFVLRVAYVSAGIILFGVLAVGLASL